MINRKLVVTKQWHLKFKEMPHLGGWQHEWNLHHDTFKAFLWFTVYFMTFRLAYKFPYVVSYLKPKSWDTGKNACANVNVLQFLSIKF